MTIRLDNIETTCKNSLDKKWTEYKLQAKNIALALGVFGEHFDRASRMRACGNRLVFGITDQGNKKVMQADLCHDALCPVCSWRKSIKQTKQLEEYVDHLKKDGYTFFLQLVPTIKNQIDIKGSMDKLKKSWSKMSRRKIYKKYFDGFYSQVEYTYNDTTGWHPHLHILVAVKKDLNFPLPAEEFALMQQEFSDVWKKITGDSFIFGVRSVRNLHEFCKYITKLDQFKGADDVEKILDLAGEIKGRRLVSKGGCFKGIKIIEDEDINIDDCGIEEEIVSVEIYTWNNRKGRYDKEVMGIEEFYERGRGVDGRTFDFRDNATG